MNENIDLEYENKQDNENISYKQQSNTNYNAKRQRIISKKIENNQKMKKYKINKNLVDINNNKKEINDKEKLKNFSDQKINKSRNIIINKDCKKTDDHNNIFQNKNKLKEKIITKSLITISNERNFRLRKNQREMLNILERLIDKIKNNLNNYSDNDIVSDYSYKIFLNNFHQRVKSISEKNQYEKSYDSYNCRSENIYNNHNLSKITENKYPKSVLFTPSNHEKTFYQNYQTNSVINSNTLSSQKSNKSNKFFSKSSINYPTGYSNITTCTFRNERSLISSKKNFKNIKFIIPGKKSCETRKITCSIIKTEKTLVLHPDTIIKPKEISEIKEKPIIEIIKNLDGSKTTIIKNNIIKTTTENKIIEVPEVNIVQNATKVILVKQFTTKEYQTIITYKDNNDKQINKTFDKNYYNKEISEETNIINTNKNDDTGTLNIKNTNANTNTNSELKKILFIDDDKVENKTDVKKWSGSSSEQSNKFDHFKNIRKNLPKSQNIKKSVNKNILISLPKKQANQKNNIFKRTTNNNKQKINKNKNKNNNITKKYNSEFSNVKKKKPKLNLNMPEDIIDISKLQKDDSSSKEHNQISNDNITECLNTVQITKSPISNVQNDNKTENLDEEKVTKKSINSIKKSKMKKLAEFIYEFNDSKNELNEDCNADELIIEKYNKNTDTDNEYDKNKFITEDEKMKTPTKIIDENNNDQTDEQKELQQEKEIKIIDSISSCKNEIEKNDNNNEENIDTIKEINQCLKKEDDSEGENNEYMFPKSSNEDDWSNFGFEKNYKINENEFLNNDSNEQGSIDNKRICINTQDIQLLDEKFKNIYNNEINSEILLNNDINASEINDNEINNCCEMNEFEKKNETGNRILQLNKFNDIKEKLSIQNETENLQEKFFVPLEKYEDGFNLNKKNPFNDN